MRFDGLDLDRCWRFALPVAWVGCAASVAWGAALAVFGMRDAPVAIDIALFLGVFPLHALALLTLRRLGRPDRRRAEHHSAFGWIWRSLLTGLVFGAAIRWRHLWGGPYQDWPLMAAAALFYGGAISTGRRYRRSRVPVPGRTPRPPVAPPTVLSQGATPPVYLVAPPWAPTPTPSSSAGADGPWATPVAVPRPPRDRPGALDTPWRLLPPAVALVVFVGLAIRGGGGEAVVGPEDRPFYLATVVDGDRVEVPGPPGEPSTPTAVVQAAACRTYRDALEDRVLGAELAIVDDPGLLRSAELLDGEWADDPVATEVETFVVRAGGAAGARARLADEGWPADDVAHAEGYLAARQQPPTRGAATRYVVYTTSTTTYRRLVVRLAIDPAAERTGRPRHDGPGDVEVRLPDGTSTVVDDALCWR